MMGGIKYSALLVLLSARTKLQLCGTRLYPPSLHWSVQHLRLGGGGEGGGERGGAAARSLGTRTR